MRAEYLILFEIRKVTDMEHFPCCDVVKIHGHALAHWFFLPTLRTATFDDFPGLQPAGWLAGWLAGGLKWIGLDS